MESKFLSENENTNLSNISKKLVEVSNKFFLDIEHLLVLTLFFKLDNAEQFIQLFKKNLDSAYNSVDALQGKPVMLNREMLEGVLK